MNLALGPRRTAQQEDKTEAFVRAVVTIAGQAKPYGEALAALAERRKELEEVEARVGAAAAAAQRDAAEAAALKEQTAAEATKFVEEATALRAKFETALQEARVATAKAKSQSADAESAMQTNAAEASRLAVVARDLEARASDLAVAEAAAAERRAEADALVKEYAEKTAKVRAAAAALGV